MPIDDVTPSAMTRAYSVGRSSDYRKWAMSIFDESSLLDDDRRVIPLFAVHNFRDLGGYPTNDGRHTRWRTLFRADGLYRLTPDDANIVMNLGVRTVVDLRTNNEVRERGTFPVNVHDVAYHHLPIIDATWGETQTPEFDDAVDFLVYAYREMLAEAAPRFADAINLLSQQSVLPAVFHCAAGKDRTGILAALVLGVLGVDESIIAADYGLTRSATTRLRAWARQHQPELADLYDRMPPRFTAADPRAMTIILNDITSRYGSVRNYVREIGVSDDAVRALVDALTTR
jgi:protein-tyrosine phosphatase